SWIHTVNAPVFLQAPTTETVTELLKSDGTAAGTTLVKDIWPGSSSAFIVSGGSVLNAFLTNVNGTLFFLANDGVSGRELWKSDGTAAGTVLAKDINPGAASGL